MKLTVLNETHFHLNDQLVDLVRIEHWGRYQGAGKFHGVRTALGVLYKFTTTALEKPTLVDDPAEQRRVLSALRRLEEYGFHFPAGLWAADHSDAT